VAKAILDSPAFSICWSDPGVAGAALVLFSKFADQSMSWVDCEIFVEMRSARITRAFTFDRHFEDAGFHRWMGWVLARSRGTATVPLPMDARSFLKELHAEVAANAGVGHSLLGRMAMDPRQREDFRIFSGQHYPLVGTFTRYLELLLLNAPSSEAKIWLAKVLVDEYGERSEGHDHAAHYRIFMRACGWTEEQFDQVALHPAVTGFIAEHLRWCTEAPFLVGLGAVGPGHEWAIPTMFEDLLIGLRSAGFCEEEIGYFTLHTVQDIDHAAWLEEALVRFAITAEAQAQIRRGCLQSLAARERLWWGIADKINAGRMTAKLPWAASSTSASGELTLREFRAGFALRVKIPAITKNP
jgi:pyrroloquinoline quinone (PQQ) biosynthesis protein C